MGIMGFQENSKKKVAIVGFGILGAVATYFLDKNKFQIHLFDLDNDLRQPDFFPDPKGPSSLHQSRSIPKGSPGNAAFWSYAVTNCIVDRSKWSSKFLQAVPHLSEQLKEIGFPKMKLQVHDQQTFLKISYVNSQKLNNVFQSARKDTRVKRHFNLVQNIAHTKQGIKISYRDSKNHLQNNDFDMAIVCAGPICTFNLLNASNILPESQTISYFDHPTFWLGTISLKSKKWIHRRFRNRVVTSGKRPGALVISTEQGYVITLRIRPLNRDLPRNFEDKKIRKFLWRAANSLDFRVLRKFGLYFCKSFSIAASLDFQKAFLRADLNESGNIESFDYKSDFNHIDLATLQLIDQKLLENFGMFQKSWDNNKRDFRGTPAAHFTGFLAEFDKLHLWTSTDSGNHRDFPKILVTGGVMFPESVIGHPTYMALLTLLYEINKMNA
jgi:hypothetical protein